MNEEVEKVAEKKADVCQVGQSTVSSLSSKETILILDDDPTTLKVARPALERDGIRVISVITLEDAVSRLQSCLSMSMVIADVQMRGGGGLALLRFLRFNLRFRHIPVIVCTSVADSTSVVLCAELGARDYIAKPIDAELLLAKIHQVFKLGKGTILIVDSDKLITNILVRTLKAEGYRPLVADSGEAALALLESQRVVLVISDEFLSDMCGLEFMAEAKSLSPQVPVILLLDRSSKLTETELIAGGADGALQKPLKNTDVIKRIVAVSQRRRKRTSNKDQQCKSNLPQKSSINELQQIRKGRRRESLGSGR